MHGGNNGIKSRHDLAVLEACCFLIFHIMLENKTKPSCSGV